MVAVVDDELLLVRSLQTDEVCISVRLLATLLRVHPVKAGVLELVARQQVPDEAFGAACTTVNVTRQLGTQPAQQST